MFHNESLIYRTDALIIVTVLAVLMICSIFLGLQIGRRILSEQHKNDTSVNGTVVASLFGLMGLLLAFTFGMSGSRFDARRQNIVEEANDIGTAVLRADLYPADQQALFRTDFKRYIEARIRYFNAGRDEQQVQAALDSGNYYAQQIWKRAIVQAQNKDNFLASSQMIPALNTMMDISSTRYMAETARVPDSIIIMLFGLSVICAFYLGYINSQKSIDWFVALGFCLLTALVIYITLDLDRPRRGLIQMDAPQQAIIMLRGMVQ